MWFLFFIINTYLLYFILGKSTDSNTKRGLKQEAQKTNVDSLVKKLILQKSKNKHRQIIELWVEKERNEKLKC